MVYSKILTFNSRDLAHNKISSKIMVFQVNRQRSNIVLKNTLQHFRYSESLVIASNSDINQCDGLK